ncbi:family 20 glycosylhydrolase, partial [Autumnicola edwardsiae]
INRFQKIVKKHDKEIIGWDEIQTADIEEGVIAQFWHSEENAIAAKKKKAKILMSPSKRAYMDMQYDSLSPLGLHWAAYIEVDSAYNWNPATLVPEVTKEDIVGIEAPLWTETTKDIEDVEYMVYPRLLGYAEIGWSPDSLRNWEEYKVRLGEQYKRFKIMDLNFHESPRVPWEK